MRTVRFLLTILIVSALVIWPAWLAVEVAKRIQDINRAVFAVMDLQIRTFHHVGGHDGKVMTCRECQKDLHEYLERLNQEFPGIFLE